jgi:hypothetical protein
MKKIIIIGNSKKLLSIKNRDIINSFDRNIRFNGFKIIGYEKYIGNIIDIVCLIPVGNGAKALLNEQSNLVTRQAKEIWFSRPKELCNNLYNTILTKFCNKKQKIVHPSLEQYNNILEKCKKIDNITKTPSSGFVAIEMAIELFKDYQIYITGFDQFQFGHYFNNKIVPKCHNIKAEKYYIEKYIKDGFLNIL